MEYEVVMYSRSSSCPFVRTAKRVFDRENVPYREVYIDQDADAEQRVIAWTGYKSVPTIIVARTGEDLPFEEPEPLEAGASPRGIDRGSMITEPGEIKLEGWLRQHGFIK
jgi:glutaredoxin